MWRSLRAFLLWALGVMGAILTLAASISADDAEANVNSWLARIGAPDLPASLSGIAVDHVVGAIGLVAIVGALGCGAAIWLKHRSKPTSSTEPSPLPERERKEPERANLQARLIPTEVRDGELLPRFRVENLGPRDVRLTGRFVSDRGGVAGFEGEAIPRIVPVGGALDLSPVLMPIKTNAWVELYLRYKLLPDEEVERTAMYRFHIPSGPVREQPINPEAWDDKLGDIPVDMDAHLIQRLSQRRGTLLFVVGLKKADGTPEICEFSHNGKRFRYDPLEGKAFFSIVQGLRFRVVQTPIPTEGKQVVTLVWNDDAGVFSFRINGELIGGDEMPGD